MTASPRPFAGCPLFPAEIAGEKTRKAMISADFESLAEMRKKPFPFLGICVILPSKSIVKRFRGARCPGTKERAAFSSVC